MIAVVVILMVVLLCIAISYRVLFNRLRRLENEFGEALKMIEVIGNAVREQSDALMYIDDYIKTSSQCILNITKALQNIMEKTAWMDGIDESLGKSINIKDHE